MESRLELSTSDSQGITKREVNGADEEIDKERSERRRVDELGGPRQLDKPMTDASTFDYLHQESDGGRNCDANRLRQDHVTNLLQKTAASEDRGGRSEFEIQQSGARILVRHASAPETPLQADTRGGGAFVNESSPTGNAEGE